MDVQIKLLEMIRETLLDPTIVKEQDHSWIHYYDRRHILPCRVSVISCGELEVPGFAASRDSLRVETKAFRHLRRYALVKKVVFAGKKRIFLRVHELEGPGVELQVSYPHALPFGELHDSTRQNPGPGIPETLHRHARVSDQRDTANSATAQSELLAWEKRRWLVTPQ